MAKRSLKLLEEAGELAGTFDNVTPDILMERLGVDSRQASKIHDTLIDANIITKKGKVTATGRAQAKLAAETYLKQVHGGSDLKALPPGLGPEARRAGAAARAARAAAGTAGEGVYEAGGKRIAGLLPAGKTAAKGLLRGVGAVAGRVLPWGLIAWSLYDVLVGVPREAKADRAMEGLDLEGVSEREGLLQGAEMEARHRGEAADLGLFGEYVTEAASMRGERELMERVEKERASLADIQQVSTPSIEEIYARLGAM